MRRISLVKRVDALTDEQRARFAEWVEKWTAIGLATGPADRPKFERSVAKCYQAAGLAPPKRVVWATSPLVMAVAAPTASFLIELKNGVAVRGAVGVAVGGAVSDAVRGAVDGAVRGAVDVAVRGTVRGAVDGAVRGAVSDAVGDAVRVAVSDAVRVAVSDAVDGTVRGAVRGTVRGAVVSVIKQSWYRYLGGQFWVGGWYWGSPAYVSFFRDVCGLDLGDEMNARAEAYAGTAESACWWWPHREFVMVCERPIRINRDAHGRLHSITQKAIEWRDGWGLYCIHGVEVPSHVVEHPEQITIAMIDAERNDEVRRIMVDIYGSDLFIRDSGAIKVQQDRFGTLYKRSFSSGPPAMFVHLINSTAEADGSRREFWRRVHPELRPLLGDGQLGEPQAMTAHNAVASTYGMRGEEYSPLVET